MCKWKQCTEFHEIFIAKVFLHYFLLCTNQEMARRNVGGMGVYAHVQFAIIEHYTRPKNMRPHSIAHMLCLCKTVTTVFCYELRSV
jgi:hypothetical protein